MVSMDCNHCSEHSIHSTLPTIKFSNKHTRAQHNKTFHAVASPRRPLSPPPSSASTNQSAPPAPSLPSPPTAESADSVPITLLRPPAAPPYTSPPPSSSPRRSNPRRCPSRDCLFHVPSSHLRRTSTRFAPVAIGITTKGNTESYRVESSSHFPSNSHS